MEIHDLPKSIDGYLFYHVQRPFASTHTAVWIGRKIVLFPDKGVELFNYIVVVYNLKSGEPVPSHGKKEFNNLRDAVIYFSKIE